MKNAPPAHLGRTAKRWFTDIQREFGITDAGGLSLLTVAADCWERAEQARKLLQDAGSPVVKDRFGQEVAHPAVRIEQSARAQLLQSLKQLNLDIEPLKNTPGRPGR